MRRWHLCFVGLLVLTAGCLGFGGTEENASQLDLTVQNDRSDPVTVHVVVSDDDGTVIRNESERVDSGVGRAFEFTVEPSGRHEVTVVGDDWQGQLAWNANTCAQFDATVRITDESVEVAGECLQQR